jgi:hypothetical protein
MADIVRLSPSLEEKLIKKTLLFLEKQDHFFVSIAHHVPEHASQAASRGSEAALTPLEKHIS